MEAIHRDPAVMSTPVENVMSPKLPTIGVGQKVERAVQMLETAPALLVLSGGRPLSVLTRTDVLAYFEPAPTSRRCIRQWVSSNTAGRGFATRAIHAGQQPDRPPARSCRRCRCRPRSPRTVSAATRATSTPGRATRPAPRWRAQVASLEEARHGLAFASGLAAEDNVLRLLDQGQRILLGNDAYGGTFRFISKVWGPLRLPVVGGRPDRSSAPSPPAGPTTTAMVWLETPTNPLLTCFDIEAIAAVAHEPRGARRGRQHVRHALSAAAVGPGCRHRRPLGHEVPRRAQRRGRRLLAVDDDELAERLRFTQNAAGAIPSPFDCYLVLRGVKTLAVRMDRHCENARAVVDLLVRPSGRRAGALPAIARPSGPCRRGQADARLRRDGHLHPRRGEGCRQAGGRRDRDLHARRVARCGREPHRASRRMTHASVAGSPLEVPDNLVRLSVGIEDGADLVADLDSRAGPDLMPTSTAMTSIPSSPTSPDASTSTVPAPGAVGHPLRRRPPIVIAANRLPVMRDRRRLGAEPRRARPCAAADVARHRRHVARLDR